MSGLCRRQDFCNCGAGRLLVANNCGMLSVNFIYLLPELWGFFRLHSLIICFFIYIGSIAHGQAHFGRGSGPILLSNLFCRGSELSLLDCNSNALRSLSCSHSEDAGVTCEGKTDLNRTGAQCIQDIVFKE